MKKMTLTRVSTWFVNARRRLKKGNEMTRKPKDKLDRVLPDSNEENKSVESDENDSNLSDYRIFNGGLQH